MAVTPLAFLLLVCAIGFAIAFCLTFVFMSDGESMNDEDPTLDVQNHRGD